MKAVPPAMLHGVHSETAALSQTFMRRNDFATFFAKDRRLDPFLGLQLGPSVHNWWNNIARIASLILVQIHFICKRPAFPT